MWELPYVAEKLFQKYFCGNRWSFSCNLTSGNISHNISKSFITEIIRNTFGWMLLITLSLHQNSFKTFGIFSRSKGNPIWVNWQHLLSPKKNSTTVSLIELWFYRVRSKSVFSIFHVFIFQSVIVTVNKYLFLTLTLITKNFEISTYD